MTPVFFAARAGRESPSAQCPHVLQRDREGAASHGVLLPPGHAPLLLLFPPGVPYCNRRWASSPLQLLRSMLWPDTVLDTEDKEETRAWSPRAGWETSASMLVASQHVE